MKKITLCLILILNSFFAIGQNPNDCINAIVICGNSSIGLDPVGTGFDEFSLPGNPLPDCYVFDQHSIWFKFNIIGSGTFMFDLVPDDPIADYDFAIFGPAPTCTELGASIRCSSTNPENAGVSAMTGLNMEETDTSEGPGELGNGYLMYIEAEVGDVYYLLVDRAVGSGGFSLFYTGTAALPLSVEANEVENQSKCDADGTQDGFTEFDLAALIPTIMGSQTDAMVSFHSSLNDANIGINDLISPYTNTANPQTIYARIETPNGCSDTTSFTIETGNPTLLQPEDVVLCSDETSEFYLLDNIIPSVISNPEGYVFSYHYTLEDANFNTNPIGNSIYFTETPTPVFVRVTSDDSVLCYNVVSFNGYINIIKEAGQPSPFIVCDEGFDGVETFNLSEKNAEILGSLNEEEFDIHYYASQFDRLDDINRITGNYQNTTSPQTIYVTLFELATGCFDYVQLGLFVNPLPVPVFEKDSYMYCLNSTEPIKIAVQSGFVYYEWSTGEAGPDLNSINVDAGGIYTVTVTNEFNCTNSVSVEVLTSDIAIITNVVIKGFRNENNTVTIIVDGIGDYEYALDSEIYYQDENVFVGVTNGYHTVSVRDKNGCGVVSRDIIVLDYPRFFTPNADGHNDLWYIKGLSEFPEINVYIFDRYGKLLKRITSLSQYWDGTNLAGNPLPSSDYWVKIEMGNGQSHRGHFTLKR